MDISEFMRGSEELDNRFAHDERSANLFEYLAVWLLNRQPEVFEEVTEEFFQQEAVISVMRTAYESTSTFEAGLKDLL